MLTANDYIIMSFEIHEFSDHIRDMSLEELEQEKMDLIALFDDNIQKRNDIIQQIEQTTKQDNINYKWLTKAKTALKYCKKDLNKLNLFLSAIRDKIKTINANKQEEKFSQILKQRYPNIYDEIVNIIKNKIGD